VRAKTASGVVEAVGFGLTEKGSVTPFFDLNAVEAIRASLRKGWLKRKDEVAE
jgi:hypothetical protein